VEKNPSSNRSRSPAVALLALLASLAPLASVAALASLAILPSACGAPDAPLKTQAAEVTSAARRPDGIVIDLPHALPPAADRADARGVVALREPLPKDAMVAVVRAYADGFLKEDLEALRALLSSDAAYITPSTTPGGGGNIVDQWQTRLRNYDYSHLAGAEIFRADKIEIKTYEESRDSRPANMHQDDVFVIVPIQTSHVGTDAFFPERVSMVLRREKGHYVIVGLDESFTP
jgi:hypothetical protein